MTDPPDAQQLRNLAQAVRRLGPDHRDPERFHVEKSEIAGKLADLAERLERFRPVRPPSSFCGPRPFEAGAVAEGGSVMERPDHIGPWVPDLEPGERLARCRSLRALVQVFCGPHHPLVVALARAEADPSDEAARLAWEALMTLPTIRRRRILASLATLTRGPDAVVRRRHG
jgi:hypothetical protein